MVAVMLRCMLGRVAARRREFMGFDPCPPLPQGPPLAFKPELLFLEFALSLGKTPPLMVLQAGGEMLRIAGFLARRRFLGLAAPEMAQPPPGDLNSAIFLVLRAAIGYSGWRKFVRGSLRGPKETGGAPAQCDQHGTSKKPRTEAFFLFAMHCASPLSSGVQPSLRILS
jgi:hypothetical protein